MGMRDERQRVKPDAAVEGLRSASYVGATLALFRNPPPPVAASARNMGLRLLGVWLLLTGLTRLFGLDFPYETLIMAVLALTAGVLLIVGS